MRGSVGGSSGLRQAQLILGGLIHVSMVSWWVTWGGGFMIASFLGPCSVTGWLPSVKCMNRSHKAS